jgi:hypothetical protein
MPDAFRRALLGLAVASTVVACSPTDGGTRCGAQTCNGAQYCVDDQHLCGSATATDLHCQQIPEACPAVVAEVCGCDGKTYSNACEAARHGVDVANPDGPCVQPLR